MGWGMATDGRMRFAPTVLEMGTMVHTCTVGMPFFSRALVSVAPQRVSVPQVEVRMAPCTLFASRSLAISSPNRSALATAVALPTVA